MPRLWRRALQLYCYLQRKSSWIEVRAWLRMHVLQLQALLSMALLLPAAAVGAAHGHPKSPNVWFLMADDLDADWKQDHPAIMPSLTKYWKEGGIEFVNHVAAVPVCGPSRSSLLTARYPHNNGYKMNSDSPSIDTWCGANNPSANMNHSVGDWLARSGYYTAFLGKTVNSCESWANSGWSHWGGLINTYDFYNASIHDVDFGEDGVTPTRVGEPKVMTGVHQAQFLAEFTVEQATIAHKADKPFFIHTTPVMPHWGTCIGPNPPHGYGRDDPHWEYQGKGLVDPATGQVVMLPISPCPSHKHAHDFDGQKNPHLASWNVSATGVVPKAMQTFHLDAYDEEREDLGWRNRSAAVVDLDDLIEAVFAGLKELGVIDDTIAIFSSDNGYHLGEKKMIYGKGHPYEPSVRLPMYVRGPGVAVGAQSLLPTTHLDITVTVLELAGATHGPHTPADLDGLSFASALAPTPAAAKLRAHPEDWRGFSFSEFFAGGTTWWNVRTVNSTHKFSVHYWCTGEIEVFDLQTDTLQLHNLADVQSSALGMAAAAEMLPLGVALSSCAHSSCHRPAPAALPPLAPNATRLPCYPITKAPQHPEWPYGSCSTVGVNHYFSGWACIPDPQQTNFTVSLKVLLDGVAVETLLANLSRPDSGRAPCGSGAGAVRHHGFVGRLPKAAWTGRHTVAVFAVNPAPNARAENTTEILLRSQKVCDGVTCGPDSGVQEGEGGREVVLGNDGLSAWG